jgi:hypothetical protein
MARTSTVVVALVAAAVTLSLAGCGTPAGSSGSPSGSAKAGATATLSPTPTATTSVTEPPAVPATNPAPPAHPLPPATAVNEADYEVPSFGATGPAFNTPSGNLHCGILRFGPGSDGGYWGCEADQHTWTFASANPGDPCYNSEVSCGHGIRAEIGGPVEVLKAGDIQFPGIDPTDYPTKVLAYGKSVSYEGITCAAESDGVTCIDTASGHGFFISKTANDIF